MGGVRLGRQSPAAARTAEASRAQGGNGVGKFYFHAFLTAGEGIGFAHLQLRCADDNAVETLGRGDVCQRLAAFVCKGHTGLRLKGGGKAVAEAHLSGGTVEILRHAGDLRDDHGAAGDLAGGGVVQAGRS